MNYIPLLAKAIRAFSFCYLAFATTGCVQDIDNGNQSYLPLNDSEYPYAELPRIVIETENFNEIRDTETYKKASFQIYGEKNPESEVIPLQIRGRGNASFKMYKYSYKLKFNEKISLFGFPKDKEWNLIANAADKSLLMNFITFKLSKWLGSDYEPRATFVELYLNRNYLGVYLFTEQIKVSKNRVNIPKEGYSFLLEKSNKEDSLKTHIKTKQHNLFVIRSPKEPTKQQKDSLLVHFNHWESYLEKGNFQSAQAISNWLDLDNYFRMYWIQEFSKNLDGAFKRSIFLTWQANDPIKFGPVWDFDMAYGNSEYASLQATSGWNVKNSGWNKYILKDSILWNKAIQYWNQKRDYFERTTDSLEIYYKMLQKASVNEFKRWPVLEYDNDWPLKGKYNSYHDAVNFLKNWISDRIKWIDENTH